MQIYVLLIVAGVAVVCDLKTNKVPNVLIKFGILVGLGLGIILGKAEFMASVFGMIEAVAILILPFACGMIGAGDVKLFMVIGCFIGGAVWRVIWWAALATALYGLVRITKRLLIEKRNSEGGFLQILLLSSSVTRIHFTIPTIVGVMLYVCV